MSKGNNIWSTAGLLAAATLLIATIGALNGGTALTASAWDTFVTWEKSLLASSFVQAGALLVVVWGIWQAAHGKGFGFLSLVVGIIAIAVLGPSVISTMATSTRPVPAAQVFHQTSAVITSQHQVN